MYSAEIISFLTASSKTIDEVQYAFDFNLIGMTVTIFTNDFSFEGEEATFNLKAIDESNSIPSQLLELKVKFTRNPLLLDMN